jgi:hypothetical protein
MEIVKDVCGPLLTLHLTLLSIRHKLNGYFSFL